MQTAARESKDRSLFEGMVTAFEPITFSRDGTKVKLIVWLSQRFETPEAIREHCKVLLEKTPDLAFAGDTAPATVVLRAMLEKEVIVYDSRGLRQAKCNLAKSVEEHLDIITVIQ